MRPVLVCAVAMVIAACGGAPWGAGPSSQSRPTDRDSAAGAARSPAASASQSSAPPAPELRPPSPAPQLPPYAIEALRSRPRPVGPLTVGPVAATGAGYTKHPVSWSSQGATMTGTLDLPTRAGRAAVVIVNHGYVPVSEYSVGLDSAKYADPLAGEGFITISPDYPGYGGSGPGLQDVPSITRAAISDIDLISSLASLPQADTNRIAMAGHSNGGGVSLIVMAVDPRVRAYVLYESVSSDMADNARTFWSRSPHGTSPLGDPSTDPGYALMSPRRYLPDHGPPVLILESANDEQIPASWGQATLEALNARGTKTSFVSFPGARHILRGADLARANGLAVEWIRMALG
ncbi:MAG: alpha/beta hydrolase family protein [Candidatus Dormibacteria bacterium]